MRPKAPNVDSYIADFPREVALKLEEIRSTIKAAAPLAEEVISYAMPAYKLNGMLVYFAGYVKHIGFYPGAGGIAAFKNELAGYKGAKGSIQFPLDKPLPIDLIKRIVMFRVEQNLAKPNKKK